MSCGQLLRVLGPAALLLICAGTNVGVASAGGAPGPSVKIVNAPPARTTDDSALIRFKLKGGRAWCRRDGLRFRRCRTSVRYSGLRPGRHNFVVRAVSGRRAKLARHRWTVLRRASSQALNGAPPAAARDGAGSPALPGSPTLVFSDDFNGASVDTTQWSLYDSPGHDGHGLRRPSAFSLDGQGNLVVTASMRNGAIVSGGMAHRTDFTYGRFVFRVRSETDPTGTMNGVVLTWPKDQWSPAFTENDMYETGWRPNNDYRFDTFIHFGVENWQKWFTHDSDPTRWHEIAMDWTPDRLDIYRDGVRVWGTTDHAAIADIPHHLCIQLDAMAERSLARPVRMFVDYVRIYRLATTRA